MLSLDDQRWRGLKGGYRQPYDASLALRRMEAGEQVWDELWEELHHQGDVGEASYAALPHMVRIAETSTSRDWNLYAIASIIEVERHRLNNPPIPDWLRQSYDDSWKKLVLLALRDLAVELDNLTLRSALAVVALGRGDLRLGALLTHAESSEIDEYLEDHVAWSKLYG
jgi:hypothetical protein